MESTVGEDGMRAEGEERGRGKGEQESREEEGGGPASGLRKSTGTGGAGGGAKRKRNQGKVTGGEEKEGNWNDGERMVRKTLLLRSNVLSKRKSVLNRDSFNRERKGDTRRPKPDQGRVSLVFYGRIKPLVKIVTPSRILASARMQKRAISQPESRRTAKALSCPTSSWHFFERLPRISKESGTFWEAESQHWEGWYLDINAIFLRATNRLYQLIPRKPHPFFVNPQANQPQTASPSFWLKSPPSTVTVACEGMDGLTPQCPGVLSPPMHQYPTCTKSGGLASPKKTARDTSLMFEIFIDTKESAPKLELSGESFEGRSTNLQIRHFERDPVSPDAGDSITHKFTVSAQVAAIHRHCGMRRDGGSGAPPRMNMLFFSWYLTARVQFVPRMHQCPI
ncbi:hypothetical protein BDK51DRAFT_31850 [Blyttiomyces helicus]|uniref:Uncharacterized protein n=1 Tax=Blyttiomyces helicus TaxID=388810 RepID=A0A4P9W284_9FUNG|nr:hypothetical protein BDK51DRAFT_31850 [Blyttiomyces helicus]|eukprot:RKO86234.1 hypothetical protein BDK51DRAFT_31850 [Blyttiomyces helicus]